MESWEEAGDEFDQMLDDGGDINIGGLGYAPSFALKNVDPIAYRMGLLDYIDAQDVDSDEFTDIVPRRYGEERSNT